jgi:hypothetical protein
MLQRLDDTYRQYAPGRSNAPPPIDWWKQPPVPPSRNALLGNWRLGAYRAPSTQQLSQTLGGPLAGLMAAAGGDDGTNPLSDFLEAGCQSVFGNGAITFEPDDFKMVNDDGRVEVHRAAYRSKGKDLVVLTPDLGMIQSLFVGFAGRDHAVVAFLNCSLDREGVASRSAAAGPGSGAQPASLRLPPAGPANASLKFQVGVHAGGGFTALSHAPVWVMTQEPSALAAAAGLALPPGTSLQSKLASDCRSIDLCKTEIVAVVHGALGRVITDSNGQAQTPQIASGRYSIVGTSMVDGRPIVWVQPVSVHPGVNLLTLDEKNGRSP